ncbi:hypothetical protein ACFST9_22075 [Hymenobacter monticola]|uniref:Uncharacterized protein n=1 Tax=Hymenobacter monticola TaxID=1705399 RepID=A0ABY4BC20_9BACT|nr:hypothetical protein [Hymenobacter monticola]UOE34210.1 hypothetical protein MTP16_00830 [Hymenobacter monticola]
MAVALSGILVGSAAAQQVAEPTSRANLILVKTAAEPAAVLAGLSTYLKSNGFLLDTVDLSRGLLTTRVLAEGETLPEQMKIRAVRGADGWRLTGRYLMGGPLKNSFTAFPATFSGLTDAPAKVAFRQVEAAARAIPAGTLSYGRAKVPFGAFTKWEDALKMPW